MTAREDPPAEAVLYNGACPVCATEIAHYAALARNSGTRLRFDDLNAAELAAWGVDADTAARRLHVRAGSEVLAGVPAFLALWRALPRYRWLARLVGLPGIRHAAVVIYDRALAPLLHRRHLARQRRAQSRSPRS